MKNKLTEHLLSIFFVTVVLLTALFLLRKEDKPLFLKYSSEIEAYLSTKFINPSDPFHQKLLRDMLQLYYPERTAGNDSVLRALIENIPAKQQIDMQRAHIRQNLNWKKFGQLLQMYGKFLFIYMLVMWLTYYGVQTIGALRFVRKKQRTFSRLAEIITLYAQLWRSHRWRQRLLFVRELLRIIARNLARMAAYFILFSPAYVIAYSVRTDFTTGSFPFLIFLGVVSNGLLINYANKFYTFLINESRKGYVLTAIVKNLHNNYSFQGVDGISLRAIFSMKKNFSGHVFNHIYMNARYQYMATLKEQASFLITGLIIIEMALNIHGHLNYELLQHLLYRNYDIVIAGILFIFYTVKITDMVVDYLLHRQNLRFENIENS